MARVRPDAIDTTTAPFFPSGLVPWSPTLSDPCETSQFVKETQTQADVPLFRATTHNHDIQHSAAGWTARLPFGSHPSHSLGRHDIWPMGWRYSVPHVKSWDGGWAALYL